MRIFFISICLLLMVILSFTVAVCRRLAKNSLYLKPLVRLIGAGITAMLFYSLFLMTGTKQLFIATLMDGLYFSGIIWLCVFLVDFILIYTDARAYTSVPKYISFGVAAADTISLIVNAFTHHMFSLTAAQSTAMGMSYLGAQFKPLYNFHIGYCFVLIFLSLLALTYKTVISSSFYRKKYASLLVQLIFAVAVNTVCYGLHLPIDYSVMLYALFVTSICYFSMYAIPKALMDRIQSNVVENLSSAICCFDIDGKCVYVNRKAKEIFQMAQGDGKKDFERLYEERLAGYHRAKEDYKHWENTAEFAGKEYFFGNEYQSLKDKRGESIGYFLKIEDRTQEIRKLREEQYRASHDLLTGLYNRESFFEKVDGLIAGEPDIPRYMICSNIKDFKLVNEFFGVDMGDTILKKYAEMILMRAKDGGVIAGRISGDRFAFIMPKKNFVEKDFLESISRLCGLTGESLYKMHIYMGVYDITGVNEPAQVMYDKANMAIELIRGDYQKVIAYYNEQVMERLLHEKNVVAEFDRAIEENEFCIFLQPQVGYDGKLLGAEALVRWQHPQRGLVFPGDFIEVIEKAGLIHRLDRYIWELAAKKLREWKEKGREQYHISVNISAKDFYYMDIYETFTGLTEKYQIAPDKLKLEITETVLMSDVKMHMEVLGRLQEYGFRIEIDDFGSGYSSLNTLKDIKADVLKIDMLFLRETENQARGRIILNSIISMAKSLGMPVITEGVETQNQVDFLTNMGCDMFQGYYFSKPIAVSAFEEKYFS